MQDPLRIPGGWEGDIRIAGGGYVCAVHGGAYLQTHLGRVERSTDTAPALRYPRMTLSGPLRIVAEADGRVVAWREDHPHWQDLGPAGATVPGIFDRAGNLHRIDRAIHDSAGGWLYLHPVTGAPMLIESSPYDPSGLALHEWIDLGDGWVIGQGPATGCYLRTPEGTYLEVTAGDALRIRAERDGDQLAICWYSRPAQSAYFQWCTLDEARRWFPVRATPHPPTKAWQDEGPQPVPTFAPAEHDVVVRAFSADGYRDDVFPAVPGRRRALVFADTRYDDERMLGRMRLAVSLDADFGLYHDFGGFDLHQIDRVQHLAAAHDLTVAVVPIQQMYPWRDRPKLTGRLHTTDERVNEIAGSTAALRARCPRVAAAMAVYRQIDSVDPHPVYNWPLSAVLDLLPESWDIVREHRLTDVLPFVWSRAEGKDGIESRPELRAAFDGLVRAAEAGSVGPRPEPVTDTERRPQQREIEEVIMAARAEMEAQGHVFSTKAAMDAHYAKHGGIPEADKRRALDCTMRAGWELARRYPHLKDEIGLEVSRGPSGIASPFPEDGDERYGPDMLMLSKLGPSVDTLAGGVDPWGWIDPKTDPVTVAAWERDWRPLLNPYRNGVVKPTPRPEPVPEPKPEPTPEPKPEPKPEQEDLSKRNALYPGERLLPGDSRQDPTGRTVLIFQAGDRNFVLYRDGAPVWSAQLSALEPVEIVMQGDGGLVARDDAGASVWGSGTRGYPGAILIVREHDWVIALDGSTLWSSREDEPARPQPKPRPSIVQVINAFFSRLRRR